jgi:hypothetical protein
MTGPLSSDHEKFARVVETLRPWLPDIVVAGGWAHRLYRLHTFAGALDDLPLTTTDVDVALSRVPGGAGNMREALRASGFREEMSGDAQPPITYYQLGSPEQPFYVEFLTPLVGGERRRDGTPDVTTTISGVIAQKLRYLEVLLHGPWSVVIGPDNGFPLGQPATVTVPNPAAYIAQKLLILDRRNREDQERDILYIHDTLQTFAAHLADVRRAWHHEVVPQLHTRRVADITAVIRSRFSDPTDLIRGAAAIAAAVGRSLPTRSLLEACQVGLAQIYL